MISQIQVIGDDETADDSGSYVDRLFSFRTSTGNSETKLTSLNPIASAAQKKRGKSPRTQTRIG
jgi:hypothetical protein